MRWFIAENKKRIACENFEGHTDNLEMSGEKVSGVITYSVNGGLLRIKKNLVYPLIRVQPNDTHASYQIANGEAAVLFEESEKFLRVEIDGVLTFYTVSGALKIVHRFYPSTELPVFYERLEIYNTGDEIARPLWSQKERIDFRIGCEGYIECERLCNTVCRPILPTEKIVLEFAFSARYANEKIPREENAFLKRKARVEELLDRCDLTTGNDTVDTMFAFAKIRAGESLFRTEKGLVHSPGGLVFYSAVWCNDECEYVAPWFGFTGDGKECEAAINGFRWYEPFMGDSYAPMPSSIIACGKDYWNGAGDRGDASMYLYGLCRYFLERGELPDSGQLRAAEWCAEYILRHINSDCVVVSDTDELENRLSSGINLSTSAISYGAFELWAILLKRLGRKKEAERFSEIRERLAYGIETWFGGELAGYKTYQYHKDCNVIRAWNCLPIYMGIFHRAEETADSIEEKLWSNGSCRSTEREQVLWDRSALYYIASLFRMGDVERGWKKLKEFSEARLLGNRVPYAVEAYPEGNMRHLSAESGLFCRIITDGLLNIEFKEKGFELKGKLPKEIKRICMKNIWIDGHYREIKL